MSCPGAKLSKRATPGGVTVLQAGRRRRHGPYGPAGEAGGGGAQQEPADVPAAPRPPAEDVVCLQSEPPGKGEPLCCPLLALPGAFPAQRVFFPLSSDLNVSR